jgi:hypothetical protein
VLALLACQLLHAEPVLQDYAKPGELGSLPAGTASLYKVPWRSNARTVSAFDALQGIGVYYKHIPHAWTQEEHNHVMRQLAAAGVKRLRLAPHYAIYITKDWKAPSDLELALLRKELRGCKAAGLRPCVIFVHIPPLGKPGTRELQDWWRQGDLMPAGEVGSTEFNAYLDKTYEAFLILLREARAAGFTKPRSYDIEMGQNLWWGAPACPRPLPSTGLDALRPGGRISEFGKALLERARADGYVEPTFWWGQTHHHFEEMTDDDLPPQVAGRAVSIYSAWSGKIPETWPKDDVWPLRPPLTFAEGEPPSIVLARPETYMADRTRRDNLIELINRSEKPIAITSLGTVPRDLPETDKLDGWRLKQRGLTRSLAFWLNQGAEFVLLHAAYEGKDAEMSHALIPFLADPLKFRWHDAPPLVTLHSLCDGLAGAKPIEKLTALKFRYALADDSVLIPPFLKASDAIALLPFQMDAKRFAVAAYVVSPNIAEPMAPVPLTLEVDRRVRKASAHRPGIRTTQEIAIVERAAEQTRLRFPVADDVTWVRIEID